MKWAFISGGLFLLVLVSLFFWLKYGKLSEPLRVGQIKIDNQVINVEIADTMFSRERGLSGRDGLALDQGMLFVFPMASRTGFWMKDMKFPLDLVWIEGDRVVGVSSQVYPEPGVSMWNLKIYYPPQAVSTVLEVPAGVATLYGWKEGSVVTFPVSGVQ